MSGRKTNELIKIVARTTLAILLMALGTICAGCAAAAIELAPLAIQAVEAVGAGVLNAAANHAAASGDKKEDDVDKRERCDNLQDTSPNVIELRAGEEGQALQWRELSLNDATGDPIWAPAMDMGTASAWRPAENLLKMGFAPPLALPQQPGSSSFLAYAAAQPQTASEQDQLTGLATGFGLETGTFQWNNRPYQYAMVTKLPCFPILQAMK